MGLSREERISGIKVALYEIDRSISSARLLSDVIGKVTSWAARLLTSDYKKSFRSLSSEEANDAALRIEMNAMLVRMESCLMRQTPTGSDTSDFEVVADIMQRIAVAVRTFRVDRAQLDQDRRWLLGIHEKQAMNVRRLIDEKRAVEADLKACLDGVQRRNWADVAVRRADYEDGLKEQYFAQLRQCCSDEALYAEIVNVAHTVQFRPRKSDDGVDIFFGGDVNEHGHAVMFPATRRFELYREAGSRTQTKFGLRIA